MEELRERGRDLPKAYLRRPSLSPGLDLFWQAFYTLNTDRPQHIGMHGMILGLIPFTSIERYAERYGFKDIDSFDRFLRLLKAMDSVYVELRGSPEGIRLADYLEPDDSPYVRALLVPTEAKVIEYVPNEPVPVEPVEAPDGRRSDQTPKNPNNRGRAAKPRAAKKGDGRVHP